MRLRKKSTSNNQTALKPKIVLGVAAHPDDIEFCAAGSMAKWIKAGTKAYYLILTNGCKGTEDRQISPQKLTSLRRQEQRQAAKQLGVSEVFFLDYEDSLLTNTPELRRDITRCIRKLKPDVVCAMDPSMVYAEKMSYINHPDHRAAGQAVLDSVFPLARDYLSFPELIKEGLEPHKVAVILLTNFEKYNFSVDISDCLEAKLAALTTHHSQVIDKEKVIKRAAELGEQCGCKYAESFIRLNIEAGY